MGHGAPGMISSLMANTAQNVDLAGLVETAWVSFLILPINRSYGFTLNHLFYFKWNEYHVLYGFSISADLSPSWESCANLECSHAQEVFHKELNDKSGIL